MCSLGTSSVHVCSHWERETTKFSRTEDFLHKIQLVAVWRSKIHFS